MPILNLTRRNALRLGASAAAMGMLHMPALGQDKSLRLGWFGSKARANRTTPAIDLYNSQRPGVNLAGETSSYDDFWVLLATQTAGGNSPDVMSQDNAHLAEYARRGVLQPLDEYIGKGLDLSMFPQSALETGMVDGKLYGISAGQATQSMIYSQTDFDSVGVAAPNADTTWDEWAELCAAVNKANPQLYGSAEASSENNLYGGWMRQLGKSVYTPDGKLGIDAHDVAQWLGFWQKMRDLNACVPADLAALDKGNAETNGLTTGYAAISFSNAQQLLTYQSMNKDQLKLTTYPKHEKGGATGHTIYTPMLWSISAKSPNIDQSVDLINFLVNEPEVAKLFGVDRGVPINKNMHQYAIPEGDESTKLVVDLVGQIVESGAPPNLPEPPASGEILTLLRRYSEEVGFGTLSPEEAGKRYIADAQEALDRALS